MQKEQYARISFGSGHEDLVLERGNSGRFVTDYDGRRFTVIGSEERDGRPLLEIQSCGAKVRYSGWIGDLENLPHILHPVIFAAQSNQQTGQVYSGISSVVLLGERSPRDIITIPGVKGIFDERGKLRTSLSTTPIK